MHSAEIVFLLLLSFIPKPSFNLAWTKFLKNFLTCCLGWDLVETQWRAMDTMIIQTNNTAGTRLEAANRLHSPLHWTDTTVAKFCEHFSKIARSLDLIEAPAMCSSTRINWSYCWNCNNNMRRFQGNLLSKLLKEFAFPQKRRAVAGSFKS